MGRGFVANYLDQDAIPLRTFVQKGLTEGFSRERRTSLSAFIRESGDITFYRHFHGPLYSYWLDASWTAGARSEAASRWASYVLILLTAAAARWAARAGVGGLAGPVAAILVLSSKLSAASAAMVSPHALFGLGAVPDEGWHRHLKNWSRRLMSDQVLVVLMPLFFAELAVAGISPRYVAWTLLGLYLAFAVAWVGAAAGSRWQISRTWRRGGSSPRRSPPRVCHNPRSCVGGEGQDTSTPASEGIRPSKEAMVEELVLATAHQTRPVRVSFTLTVSGLLKDPASILCYQNTPAGVWTTHR